MGLIDGGILRLHGETVVVAAKAIERAGLRAPAAGNAIEGLMHA
jgi:hypothetical protein